MSQNNLESVVKKNIPANLHESALTGCGKRNFYPQPEAYWKKDAKHPTNWICHFFSINFVYTVPNTPFTKGPVDSAPYSLESSTASSITTLGGVSSFKSS